LECGTQKGDRKDLTRNCKRWGAKKRGVVEPRKLSRYPRKPSKWRGAISPLLSQCRGGGTKGVVQREGKGGRGGREQEVLFAAGARWKSGIPTRKGPYKARYFLRRERKKKWGGLREEFTFSENRKLKEIAY